MYSLLGLGPPLCWDATAGCGLLPPSTTTRTGAAKKPPGKEKGGSVRFFYLFYVCFGLFFPHWKRVDRCDGLTAALQGSPTASPQPPAQRTRGRWRLRGAPRPPQGRHGAGGGLRAGGGRVVPGALRLPPAAAGPAAKGRREDGARGRAARR